jgi:nucleoside 2-deoxyribosyltransferase
MKVYLACQITGRTYDEVTAYLEETAEKLRYFGYEVLNPLTGKDHLRTGERPLEPSGYTHYASTDHAIYERDQWMVRQADVVFVNLTGMTRVSIGMMMELAWASLMGKLTVVALGPEDTVYRHAFVHEAADVVCATAYEAIKYLAKLSGNFHGD